MVATRLGLIQASARMSDIATRHMLLLSLQRALLGQVHPLLRQASIEADPTSQVVRLRFEYDGNPSDAARDSCSSAELRLSLIFQRPGSWTSNIFPHRSRALCHLLALLHTGARKARIRPDYSFKPTPLRGLA